MVDIFISYTKEDLEKAQIFVKAFESQGFSVWWDPEILPGKTVTTDIYKAIKEAKCVVVLWSKKSTNSYWVNLEASEGRQQEKLIPIFIENVDNIPFEFRPIQSARLIDWDGQTSHPIFCKVVKSINEIINHSHAIISDESHNKKTKSSQTILFSDKPKNKLINIHSMLACILLLFSVVIALSNSYITKKTKNIGQISKPTIVLNDEGMPIKVVIENSLSKPNGKATNQPKIEKSLTVLSDSKVFISKGRGAIKTNEGKCCRIITKRPCKMYSEPRFSPDSFPCDIFQFWYVLPSNKEEKIFPTKNYKDLLTDGFYRVSSGDSESEFLGYIHSDDAEIWTDYIVAGFSAQKGRKLVNFFSSFDQAVAAAISDDISNAVYREPLNAGENSILIPVLESKEVTDKNKTFTVYKTAFIASPSKTISIKKTSIDGARTLGSNPLTVNSLREESTVDIVFVIDTTSGMKKIINQVKKSVLKVTNELEKRIELKNKIRYGLVDFRDEIGSPNLFGYNAKIICTLDRGLYHYHFLDCLEKLKVAPEIPEDDFPDDVLAGLNLGMSEDMNWNPLGWKNIIVVTNASIKERKHPTLSFLKDRPLKPITEIVDKAQHVDPSFEMAENRYVISAVYVKDPSKIEDVKNGVAQYSTLVHGRLYSGKMIHVPVENISEDLSEKLADSLIERFNSFNMIVLGKERLTAMDLYTLDSLKPFGKDELNHSYFGQGYVTQYNSKGYKQLETYMWVRKGDLLSFNSILEYLLNQLEDAGEPGHKDVQRVLSGMQVISTVINLENHISADMPLDHFLAPLGGFPLKRSVFKVTIRELVRMRKWGYMKWERDINAWRETLGKIAENSKLWRKLHHMAKEREAIAFIPIEDLP